SKSGMMTAFSFGLTASTRAMAASTSAEGLSLPRRTSSAWAVASRVASSSDMPAPYDSPAPGHKKWYSGAMPILGARHDFAHPVEADTAWSESYYFNAYDPVADTGRHGRDLPGAHPRDRQRRAGTIRDGCERRDAAARRQGSPRAGGALERVDRGRRRALRARPGARQPRQVVGTAPLGWTAHVALVLDQRRRRRA